MTNESENLTEAGGVERFRWVGRPIPWLIGVLWLLPGLWISTRMYKEFQGTPKEMSWFESCAFHAPSWLMLVPATPLLFEWVRTRPISRDHPWRIVRHVVGAVVFGGLFLLVAAPVRNALHPDPHQWSMIGQIYSKSIPQYIAMGTMAYAVVVVLGSLSETRQRLRSVLEVASQDAEAAEDAGEAAVEQRDVDARVTMTTPGGLVIVRPSEIRWISVTRLGTRLHTIDQEIDVRHSMSELHEVLGPFGFARIHRSTLVNTDRIRRVDGAPTRDGTVTLDDGQVLAVSRRRRGELGEVESDEATKRRSDEGR